MEWPNVTEFLKTTHRIGIDCTFNYNNEVLKYFCRKFPSFLIFLYDFEMKVEFGGISTKIHIWSKDDEPDRLGYEWDNEQ